MSKRYPKSSVVRPGAILGYIINSIMTAECVDFATFSYWKGQNYLINGHGLYGAVTFEGKAVVGAFFDPHSELSPYQNPTTYDLNRFFRGMPADHRSLVEREALQFMREIVYGISIPCVTAAFWDEGAYLTAADPWDIVLAEGARLVKIELIEDTEEALAEWQEAYQMTQDQVRFARLLFSRKITCMEATMKLSLADSEWLRSTSKDTTGAGLAACREKLATIGIMLP